MKIKKSFAVKFSPYCFSILISLVISVCDSCDDKTVSTTQNNNTNENAVRSYSNDEGITWTVQIIDVGFSWNLKTLYSVTSTSPGIILAAGVNESDQPMIVKSPDSGQNWNEVDNDSFPITGVHFNTIFNSNPGQALALIKGHSSYGYNIFLSTDDGTVWRRTSNVSGLNSLFFYNAFNGVAVGEFGNIYRSSDGGYNWVQVQSPVSSELWDVSFYASTGMAVGDNGTIIKTTDGGLTWIQLSNSIQHTLKGVAFYYQSYGAVAVGSSGAILRTFNSGTTWDTVNTSVNYFLYDVAALSNSTLVAVGTTGTIVRSTNYGADWSQVTSGTTRDLNGVFYKSGVCHTVGE